MAYLGNQPADTLGVSSINIADGSIQSVDIADGAVTAAKLGNITTANITENTNLYYTDARARAAISITGSGSYNSSTGVITVNGGVTSVNTLTGAVTLTTANITENTNLYYTDARARAAISAGTGITYSTGVITNAGVTSAVAGTGIGVSSATGAVTISIGQAVATNSNVQFNSLGIGTAGSGTAGEIRATNNVTAYYSDDRLKTRLGVIQNALDKLDAIEGFYYEANELAQSLGYKIRKEVGLSAQSVQKIMPEVVTAAPIDDKYLTIWYERLIPLLVEAIKELRCEIKALRG